MAWCRQATSHYLSQCWPRSPYGVTKPQWVEALTLARTTVWPSVVCVAYTRCPGNVYGGCRVGITWAMGAGRYCIGTRLVLIRRANWNQSKINACMQPWRQYLSTLGIIFKIVNWLRSCDEHIRSGIQEYFIFNTTIDQQGNNIHKQNVHDVPTISRLLTSPSLVQIMAYRLFGTKPLSEPALDCCKFDP